MIKKLIPHLVTAISVMAIFSAGAYSGIYILINIKNSTLLQDEFIKSTNAHYTLQNLDKAEYKKAREYLKLVTDSSIVSIDSLSIYADPESLITGCNILKNIANHREEHKEKYIAVTEIEKSIEVILSKWKHDDCK